MGRAEDRSSSGLPRIHIGPFFYVTSLRSTQLIKNVGVKDISFSVFIQQRVHLPSIYTFRPLDPLPRHVEFIHILYVRIRAFNVLYYYIIISYYYYYYYYY